MAPPLDAADRSLIDLLLEDGFRTQAIAQRVKCSARTVQRMHRKRKQPNMPRQKARTSRRSCLTPAIRKAIYDKLIEDAELYIEELVEFILENYSKKVSKSSVARAVKDWPRKKLRYIAQQQDNDLQDLYLYTLRELNIKSYICIFVDKSGCNARVSRRQYGRSPKGTTPVQVAKLRHGKR